MHILQWLSNTANFIRQAVLDDKRREELLFRSVNGMLALVATVMTIVNIFTGEHILMLATLIFAVLCLLNLVPFVEKLLGKGILQQIFTLEFLALLGFFFISGIPDGFSCLWSLLIPSFSLLIFGMKGGIRMSLWVLAGMIFLFWFPQGQALLQYGYSPTFMLRFPFLYMAMLALSILVEYIRVETQRHLVQMERKYKNLYSHDALTGIYNRHGMNEILGKLYAAPNHRPLAVMIMDIDDFKMVNDRYGHNAGDAVLQYAAKVIARETCQHCSCARWGGEEFLVLMQCQHDPVEMAEKLRKMFENACVRYEGQQIRFTMSFGVFVAEDMTEYTVNQLINAADQCLYRSKAEGKNRVTYRR